MSNPFEMLLMKHLFNTSDIQQPPQLNCKSERAQVIRHTLNRISVNSYTMKQNAILPKCLFNFLVISTVRIHFKTLS